LYDLRVDHIIASQYFSRPYAVSLDKNDLIDEKIGGDEG
jgi:hypothetical protein